MDRTMTRLTKNSTYVFVFIIFVSNIDCFIFFQKSSFTFKRNYKENLVKPFPEMQIKRSRKLFETRNSSKDLVVGINKYSHDVSCCILSNEAKPIFIGEKERLSRKKHAGGDASILIEHALDSIGANLDDISLSVVNNHHFPALSFEETLPWAVKMKHFPESYLSPYNLIMGISQKHEISHHLAHAWSVLPQCPFDEGIIVVMDGMGETYEAMLQGLQRADYTSDLNLLKEQNYPYSQVPRQLSPHTRWREAESVYTFGKGLALRPFFKRWTQERSPSVLENFGFENMESMGAVYSRVSSHIFGDWNACGKVMGLAPWARVWGEPTLPQHQILKGQHLFKGRIMTEDPESAEAFQINWQLLNRLPDPNALEDKTNLPFYAQLAFQVQQDLELTALQFLNDVKEKTGATNLCLAGGVALNSVLNGRIVKESGFDQVFIPPYTGDEGISVGCALFGAYMLKGRPPLSLPKRAPFSPYQGHLYDEEDILDALTEFAPWIEVECMKGKEEQLLEETAEAISNGEVVAWFQGRAEVGPRALGHRSILADPRNVSMISHLNSKVKRREDFRPFAPSVLDDHALEWFPGLENPKGPLPEGSGGEGATRPAMTRSPFMSLTTVARWPDRIPAVCHVDQSSRLQTVLEKDNPLYYKLIYKFFKLTGVPMILNTSFNVREPIVESPVDAIKCMLSARGGINQLVIGEYRIRHRAWPSKADRDKLTERRLGIRCNFISEVVSSNNGDSIRVQIKLSTSEEWIQLGEIIDLNIMELLSKGNKTVKQIISELYDLYEGITVDFSIQRIQQLYESTLIFLD